MVDLMTGELRAAVTDEAPGGEPLRLSAAILLVASCVHHPLVDGGAVPAPCTAVVEPGRGWSAERPPGG